jgi:hypothetical protein
MELSFRISARCMDVCVCVCVCVCVISKITMLTNVQSYILNTEMIRNQKLFIAWNGSEGGEGK